MTSKPKQETPIEQILPEETSIERAVRILNEAFALDPRTIEWLATTSFPCHDKLAEHKTVPVKKIRTSQPMGGGIVRHEVGLLGILNGIFAADIVTETDDSGKMVGFKVLEELPDE